MPAFWVKLGTDDLNCVDVPLNPTHLLSILLDDDGHNIVSQQ